MLLVSQCTEAGGEYTQDSDGSEGPGARKWIF